MQEPIVIVGAGQAGAKAAETLRRLDPGAPIMVIGDELHPPYQRPPLSKKFLAGQMAEAQLWLHGGDFYVRQGIDLLTGTAVVGLDPERHEVRLSDGRTQTFAKLLLATGSRPRRLSLPGCDLLGVHTLRGIADVAGLREDIERARRVAIIGGGYIGLEVASVLVADGRQVVVIEAQERLVKRALCPIMSSVLEDLHRKRGVDIRLGAQLLRIVGDGRVEGVELADGTIAADVVLVAIGGVANDELAAAAGLVTRDGVLVDAHARVRDDIFAAGDCARLPLPRYGTSGRLESVQNAIDQARAAAGNMLGSGEAYDPVPWFWSDQFEAKLQIAGLSEGHDRSVVEGDPSGAFAVSYFRGDRLLAVASLNAPRAHMEARRKLAAQRPVGG